MMHSLLAAEYLRSIRHPRDRPFKLLLFAGAHDSEIVATTSDDTEIVMYNINGTLLRSVRCTAGNILVIIAC